MQRKINTQKSCIALFRDFQSIKTENEVYEQFDITRKERCFVYISCFI